jgi:hypothetical protein
VTVFKFVQSAKCLKMRESTGAPLRAAATVWLPAAVLQEYGKYFTRQDSVELLLFSSVMIT